MHSRMMHSRMMHFAKPRMAFQVRASATVNTFYKTNNLSKYDNKNVIYIAYVGQYNNQNVYKYGKSSNMYQREMTSHRKNFEAFQMQNIYLTNHKDYVEVQLEKELKLRHMHVELVIKNKKQTELFYTTPSFDIHDVDRLVRDIIHEFSVQDAETRTIELERIKLQREIIKLQREQVKLEMMQIKLKLKNKI